MSDSKVAEKYTALDVRRTLLNELKRDLHGQSQNEEWQLDEVLEDPPAQVYICGVLFPQGERPPAECDEESNSGESDEETGSDDGIPVSENPILPSSIGLTFAIDSSVEQILVDYWYAQYTKELVPIESATDKSKIAWRRIAYHDCQKLDLSKSAGRERIGPSASLDWYVRTVDDAHVITVFLVNENISPAGKEGTSDELCLFQPKLKVRVDDEKGMILAREESLLSCFDDSDLENYRLLYRGRDVFAMGHGCATDWPQPVEMRVTWVATSIVPAYEIPIVSAKDIDREEIPGLSMRFLSESSSADAIVNSLLPLLEKYKSWIGDREKEVGKLDPILQPRATTNLESCREAYQRMADGLNVLRNEEDTTPLEAFRFMNEAMLNQRLHSAWAYKRRKTVSNESYSEFVKAASEPCWRPFQIAFILMCLPEMVDPSDERRNLVDLLWFPTGGGKTEAYLGLSAFTMALRRRNRNKHRLSGDGGVTILMRYTLRLLTIQQFQRAAALICACEEIRRRAPDKWGQNQFLIGLWVGQKATPNSIKLAEEAFVEIESKGDEYRGSNPMQLVFCPSCGQELGFSNYKIDAERKRMSVICSNSECSFSNSDGLPVAVIDEEIYLRCPDIVISTVDKFAALPTQSRTSALFGRVTRFCPRHGYVTSGDTNCLKRHDEIIGKLPAVKVEEFVGFRPPELIVQDELHLISGPLGTLVGLYEFAVDRLSDQTTESIPASKVIASTATIRRASDQVNGLFSRGLRQFPPPGLKASDSFFAFENNELPGRLYVGVWTPGKSGKTSSIRIIASLLNTVQRLEELLPGSDSSELIDICDPYGTLIAYFNSLRDLGGNLRLAEDDIPQRLKLLSDGAEATRLRHAELTSRLKSDEIPKILDRMESPASDESGLDILHATNMISVGVDVERLGLMVVHGQPKGTAEYIQASSRIGRSSKAPGLVVTRYNWNRARDTDHYERFKPYHSMLYRYVEATSVTPLSPRALDKGLHAVVFALVRHLQDGMIKNKSAAKFTWNDVTDSIVDWLEVRASSTRMLSASEMVLFRKSIEAILEGWVTRTTASPTLRYNANRFDKLSDPANREVLMREIAQPLEGAYVTLTSLREVEKNSTLFYVREK